MPRVCCDAAWAPCDDARELLLATGMPIEPMRRRDDPAILAAATPLIGPGKSDLAGDKLARRDMASSGHVVTSSASVVVFGSRGLAALRRTLHSVWDGAAGPREVIVRTTACDAETASYLVRQYHRGKIASFGFDVPGQRGPHCDVDRVCHLATRTYIARVSDEVGLEVGWLDNAVAVMDAVPEVGCVGLIDGKDNHKPGRRHKLSHGAVQTNEVDVTCFVTRRRLLARHDRRLAAAAIDTDRMCVFQVCLKKVGFVIAHLPGLVADADPNGRCRPDAPADAGGLPLHAPSSANSAKLRQIYELGEDVLFTCPSCGNGVLEVLAAEVEFCAGHGVPVGHTYTMHCGQCGRLQLEEDVQLACPQSFARPTA